MRKCFENENLVQKNAPLLINQTSCPQVSASWLKEDDPKQSQKGFKSLKMVVVTTESIWCLNSERQQFRALSTGAVA